MKIYFCDLCDQSIPLSDITEGRATTVKGKVLCTQCLPKPSEAQATPTIPATERPEKKSAPGFSTPLNPVLLSLAILALLIGIGSAALAGFAYARLRDLEGVGGEKRAELVSSVKHLTEDLDGVHEKLEEQEEALARRPDREALAALSVELEALRTDIAAARAEWSRGLAELRSEAEGRNEQVTSRLSLLQGEQQVLAEKLELDTKTLFGRVAELEKRGLRGADTNLARTDPVPQRPAGEERAEPVAEALPAAVQEQLDKLSKGDISERWVALTELTKLRDPRVVPHVVKYLRDEDPFVRHAAAQFLGEVEARESVGELIDALGDDEAFVRDGVYLALRKITRQNLKFDAHAPPEQRKKAREKWSDWWKTNEKKFLEEGER